jgi:AraC-like DNA-binding protein
MEVEASISLSKAAKNYCDPAMNPRRLQKDFFTRLADPSALRQIFEHLPDVYFFVKDTGGRMIAASPVILARLGLKSEEEFIGRTDFEVYPKRLAEAYTADDAQVFRTGKPLLNRLEIWFDEVRNSEWCVTTKVPLRGRDGKVIGLMGITRRDQGRLALQPAGEAARAVEFLRRHSGRTITAAELAKHLAVSERTLNRKINEAFGISPYELTLRVRIQKSAEALLLTRDDIAGIALAHGFCDQSAFTHHFRKRMGTTPKKFRLRHAGRIA